MMQIYLDAIKASKNGPDQYVLCRSLDLVRVSSEKKSELLDLLRQGYQINSHAVNGVLESNYDTKKAEAIETIASLVGTDWGAGGRLHVVTQEFYSDQALDCRYMDMSFVPDSRDMVKPSNLLVTPKDKLADKALFDAGQKKAEDIMDVIHFFSPDFTHGEDALKRMLERILLK